MGIIGQRLLVVACVFIFLLLVVCITACVERRVTAAARVREMSAEDKERLLNALLRQFGYFYYEGQDLVLTRVDAWQRKYGYEALYDRMAMFGGMIFQCFPIYFDYGGKTWLLEIWKGQYGITCGCEMGLYHTDRIVEEKEYGRAHFESASDEEMQDMTIILEAPHMEGFAFHKKHWWLAGFRVGEYHAPKKLHAVYQIRFRDPCMLCAVWKGLERAGYPREQYHALRNTLVIRQQEENALKRNLFGKIYARLVLFKNHCLVKLFRCYTVPFQSAGDRILFLYFRMPGLFRKIFGGIRHGVSEKTRPGI